MNLKKDTAQTLIGKQPNESSVSILGFLPHKLKQ